MRTVTDVFASVSKPGKGGAVREVLTAGYPKLAQLLEAAFDRLASETTMKVGVWNGGGGMWAVRWRAHWLWCGGGNNEG